ncbi:MAG: hypothetical protein HYV07_24530 [Deltaproteobacteria bacterium]|nr:hypothetical protein [Deltaproteobacteria bacterium]
MRCREPHRRTFLLELWTPSPTGGPSEATGGTLFDLTAEFTMVIEVEEDRVNVQESLPVV